MSKFGHRKRPTDSIIRAGICDGSGIPYQNFKDYFKYAATTPSNGCPALPTATAAFKPAISGTATTTLPINLATQYPITDGGSCDAIYKQCRVVSAYPRDIFTKKYCVLAAACQRQNSDDLILRLFADNIWLSQGAAVILSAAQSRLPSELFHQMANGADAISQQVFVDAYYSALTNTIVSDGARRKFSSAITHM